MTGPSAQLILDLGHRPALGRADFLVVPENEVAVGWIDRWPDWPQAGLALYGPAGSGKTHLAQVWRAASGAVGVDAADLDAREPPELLRDAVACVFDAADALFDGSDGQDRAERRLLHLYNLLVQRGGQLLITGRPAPARWPVALADLRSRLAALPAVGLGAPGDVLIEAVLVKLFADRQVRVDPPVIRYLLTRMERSLGAARSLVEALDRASLQARRQVSVSLARRVLDDLAGAAGAREED